MNAYRINNGQKNAIENQPFANNQYFNPVKDINGDWFIFEIEINAAVKNRGWVKAALAEFIPPPITQEI